MKTNFSGRSLLLVFAVIFTTFPVLLFGTLQVFEEFAERNVQANELNRRSAELVRHEIRGNLDQTQALLEGMALQIDPTTLRPREPEKIRKVLADHPLLMAVVVLDANAVSVASYSLQIDIRTGVDYSDRPPTKQVRETRKTAVSGNIQGRATNIPTVVTVVPLLDEKGGISGFFSGSVSPNRLASSANLGNDEYDVVMDSFGRIVIANPGKTSMTVPQLESMARSLAGAPDGTQKFTVGNRPVDIQILTIDPIAWKVFVGVAPEFLTARTIDAIRRTGILATVCAAIGVVITGLVSFAAARGVADVGVQLQEMSPVDLKPIRIGETRFVTAELRGLIENFNHLLHRTAQAKLAELEAISFVADAIIIAKADGTITYVNEAGLKMFGDVVGRNFREIIDHQPIAPLLHENVSHEWKGDILVKKPDGATFDGFLSATSILDNGQVTSIVAIVQDITKEKAARESLTQSEKMITLGELVAGTSHELNNPLAIVTGYSDLLLEDETLSLEQRTKIESIRKNALRASSVVHSLLAFARKRKPERVKTDVNAVVEAAAGLKEYDLTTSGIVFEMKLAPSLPAVFADPHQLQQVLLNLINNAQDAVLLQSTQPRIVIRTETRGDVVLIVVQDNGSGIAKTDLKKVFDPFFTTKPVGKGTGLGLSISYGIIREHNGDIYIESDPGEGTRVAVELPVDRGAFQVEETPLSPPAAARAMRLLVVDDEIDIVTILRSGLSRPGVIVDSAVTIADAISLASAISYDFVLTDVKMPGGSGIDLYRQLCQLNPIYSDRTIFLTGDTSNSATLQFLEEKELTYFSKPFDVQALERYLRQVAEKPQPG